MINETLIKQFNQLAFDRGLSFAKTTISHMLANNAIESKDIYTANILLRIKKAYEYGSPEYIEWIKANYNQDYKPDPQKLKDVFGIVLNDLKK